MKTFNSSNFNQTAIKFAKAFGVVSLISLYDAVFGAGISAGLWPNIVSQQAVNDMWQASLGIVVFAALWLTKKYDFDVAFSVLTMLIAYVEDTLYYTLLPVTKYIVSFLSHSKLIVEPGFPEKIGGYLGWFSRWIGIVPSVDFPVWVVLVMNVIGIAVAGYLLWKPNKE
jgi:hypothetical protein